MILGFTGFRFYSTTFLKKIRVYRVWLFLSFFWLFLSFFCIFCYFFHFFIIFLSFLLFWKNLIKRSIIFFPAFDRSIECISHMTYDMDSKTFFCQQNLSKLLLHAKKSPKRAFRVYIYTRNALFGDFFACNKSLDKFCWQKKVFESMSYVMWDMHSIDLSNAGKKIIDRLIRFFQNNKKDKKMIKKWKK